MNTQVFTTFDVKDFRSLLTETVREAVKEELTRLTSQPLEHQKQFLTRKEAAIFLGVTVTTLHTWSKTGIVPCQRVGTRVRYRFTDLDAALRDSAKRGAE